MAAVTPANESVVKKRRKARRSNYSERSRSICQSLSIQPRARREGVWRPCYPRRFAGAGVEGDQKAIGLSCLRHVKDQAIIGHTAASVSPGEKHLLVSVSRVDCFSCPFRAAKISGIKWAVR